jgi:hypothetical protein
LYGYTGGTGLFQLSAGYLDLGTNNTTRLRIDANGDVGIGTTNPTEKLHVIGNVFAGFYKSGAWGRLGHHGQQHGGATYAGLYGMSLTYNAYYSAGWLSLGGGNASAFSIDEGIFSFSNSNSLSGSNQAITWTTRLMIDTAGNVGIGTTSPGRKLDVRLSSSTVYSASSMETSSLFSYMRNPDGTTGAYAGIQFAISNNSDAAIAGVRTADAACAIAFGTRGVGSGAIIERMRIASDGQITMPYQPRFFAYGVSDGTFASGSYWIFPSTHVNTGGHYNASNGIFTAPVTGTYYFFWGNIGTPANDVLRYYIQKNNASIGDFHNRIDTGATGTEYGHNGAVAIMLNLTAGDYVRIYFASDGGNSSYPSGNDTTNPYPYFGGYLLG